MIFYLDAENARTAFCKGKRIWQRYFNACRQVQEKAEFRLSVIKDFYEFFGDNPKTMAISLAAQKHNISPRTIRNWLGMLDGVSAPNYLPSLITFSEEK